MPLDAAGLDLSCTDWEQRLREGRSLVPDLPLNEKLAARAVGIFNMLRLYDVVGTPPMSEVGGDWWRDIMRAIFGSLDTETGIRLVRGLFCLVPKKNAKTTNAAGMGLTGLIMNDRPAAEFLLTGPSQEISDKAFNTVRGMIANDSEGYLQKRFHVANHIKTITDRTNDAMLKVKTFDEDIVTGAVVAGAIIDEIHLLGRKPRASWIIQQLRGGMVTVPEAFFAMITTQSFEPPAGVFADELKIARAIRDGRVKGVDTLPVLYEFTEAQQKDRAFWENPDNWPLVTPNLNRSIRIPRLVKDYEEAKLKGEKDIRVWASQHLNIEIGLALHSERWRGADHWEAAADATLVDLPTLLARSEVVVMGGDGGGLDDLLGLAVLGREKGTRRWLLWVHAWCHESVLELRKSEAALFEAFAAAGDLTICKELGDDLDEVEDICREVVDSGLLPQKNAVGVDTAGLGGLVDAMEQGGITREQIVGISQGWRLSGAIMTTERALADGTMVHGGQKIMNYCVGNAKIEPRGSAKLITKQGSGVGKIDPLMATFDAASLMSMNPQPKTVADVAAMIA
jgi:phage terminase large subunit-like protein